MPSVTVLTIPDNASQYRTGRVREHPKVLP